VAVNPADGGTPVAGLGACHAGGVIRVSPGEPEKKRPDPKGSGLFLVGES